MTRAHFERKGRRPRLTFDLARVFPPGADVANRMTRAFLGEGRLMAQHVFEFG